MYSIDQPSASSNVIASAESKNDPDCNPDGSPPKKKRVVAECKLKKAESPEPVLIEQDNVWECEEGRPYVCCAIAGRVYLDPPAFTKREFCIPRENILDRLLGHKTSRLTMND